MESVRAIRIALDNTPTSDDVVTRHQGSTQEIAVRAVMSAPKIETDRVKLGEALASLYRVRAIREETVEAFSDQVCDALERLSDEKIRLKSAERSGLREKLVVLLGADGYGLIAKTRDLNAEHERKFCNARILTDLRPIFGPNIESGPQALFVSHVLRLAYHEGKEETEDFYISLGADDLRELRRIIDRAESKARSLRTIVKDTRVLGIPRD
jgi:hypothetical protein